MNRDKRETRGRIEIAKNKSEERKREREEKAAEKKRREDREGRDEENSDDRGRKRKLKTAISATLSETVTPSFCGVLKY